MYCATIPATLKGNSEYSPSYACAINLLTNGRSFLIIFSIHTNVMVVVAVYYICM